MNFFDNEWRGFKSGRWSEGINLQSFIMSNITSYNGDESFLESPTESTKKLWEKVSELFKQEIKAGGPLEIDVDTISTISSHNAGYIDKGLEKIVGLQTDKPLKRSIMPYGGIRVVENSCKAYGYDLNPSVSEIFTKYRRTHNDGVFSAYNSEIRAARKSGIITGLPDGYGRGRIIGDYRRIALYGLDYLIEDKKNQKLSLDGKGVNEESIRNREELTDQLKSLAEIKVMAKSYGYDISKPAQNTLEAFQWVYFGYLAAIKEQNGAAMSLGRVSSFLDIYIERDLKEGTITEVEAQEIMDHFVMKLRMVRFLRTPSYDELFSGDPIWVTEAIGGMSCDGRSLVTKSSYRILHTLYNLGPSPEPNLTVLWSTRSPQNWKNYCAKVSIDTSAIQYESDFLMRKEFGDDYSIACCVSAMRTGKQMQFFGARCNLAKTLLYAINGGKDELSGIQVGPRFEPITSEYLDYDEVMEKFDNFMSWIAHIYVDALNIIHYMHDKYAYESVQMALHDLEIHRTMACGIAGLSVVADSLSAIKYAKVKVIRNEDGNAVSYETEGDFPKFGNDDNRVDSIATDLVERFMHKLQENSAYRNSKLTQSILTITSNVVYGKKTGDTPCGRKKGEPFAPGANPMHGRDSSGAIASMASVAKLPYEFAEDGISYTFSASPSSLGKTRDEQVNNLTRILDGYVRQDGHHINVNVLEREMLLDAMDHPEQYPQLTVRVSGYAVNFVKLTREQQYDVINRTFHTEF
ncbi:formate C-acetyltransferase [Thiospirochaeta perfilievii]|uniref:Formate acetyltransferase n=1 Tax=Thiospirochaeta perfilievii TaxID=252967 RepID=A0A5C1QF32_9SPIO|nr:formate C-acetyltransferase [Thiospirochaeta perfilievii]QEN06017.1 formate C-acetyltransferase [Thiospirochaeta perfilievii]